MLLVKNNNNNKENKGVNGTEEKVQNQSHTYMTYESDTDTKYNGDRIAFSTNATRKIGYVYAKKERNFVFIPCTIYKN